MHTNSCDGYIYVFETGEGFQNIISLFEILHCASLEDTKKVKLFHFSSFSDPNANQVEDPWLDLFVWAVLANRRDMAQLIWSKGRETIAMALMATKLLKGLVEKVLSERDMVDIGNSLLEHARYE